MSTAFIVCMGIGTVFIGLICIIILCKVIGIFCMLSEKKDTKTDNVTITPVAQTQPIQNRQEIIAAVSAAVAEELGKDISAIRILSFKKI